MLTLITALAVDPASTKVACYAERLEDFATITNIITLSEESTQSYVFVLDTETGLAVSGLMKMVHSDKVQFGSAGFLLNNDGNVFMAKKYHKGSTEDHKAMLVSYNSI